MSVIVAIKENGKIYVGADSQATAGGCRSSLTNPNNYKIWKVKDSKNCIMGHVGSLRDACAIRILHCFIDENEMMKFDSKFDYVVFNVEPKIRDTLIDHKFIGDEKPYDDMDSRFLFCHKDKMFTISYGAIIEHDNYLAIGSGESSAIGSLVSTEGLYSPEERIIMAIKASAVNDIHVDYPIIITDTETMKFKVVFEKDRLNQNSKEDV